MTIEDTFKKYSSLPQIEEGSREYLIDLEDFKQAVEEYTRAAIRADRENVAKYALVSPLNHDGYNYGSTDNQYIDPIEGNDYFPFGGSVIVDKESIINAPEIELI